MPVQGELGSIMPAFYKSSVAEYKF